MWSHVRPQCSVPCWEKGSWQKYPQILTSVEWNIYLMVFGFPFPMRSREKLLCYVLSFIDFLWMINHKPSQCSVLIRSFAWNDACFNLTCVSPSASCRLWSTCLSSLSSHGSCTRGPPAGWRRSSSERAFKSSSSRSASFWVWTAAAQRT